MLGFRSEVGMTVLVDQSGRVFTRGKCTLKDIVVNQQVWAYIYIYDFQRMCEPLCMCEHLCMSSVKPCKTHTCMLEFIQVPCTTYNWQEKYMEDALFFGFCRWSLQQSRVHVAKCGLVHMSLQRLFFITIQKRNCFQLVSMLISHVSKTGLLNMLLRLKN